MKRKKRQVGEYTTPPINTNDRIYKEVGIR
jgi:hypothetical protein